MNTCKTRLFTLQNNQVELASQLQLYSPLGILTHNIDLNFQLGLIGLTAHYRDLNSHSLKQRRYYA